MAYSVQMKSGFNTVVDYCRGGEVIRVTPNDLDDIPLDLDGHEFVCQLYPGEVDEFVLALLRGVEAETGVRSPLLDKLEA